VGKDNYDMQREIFTQTLSLGKKEKAAQGTRSGVEAATLQVMRKKNKKKGGLIGGDK